MDFAETLTEVGRFLDKRGMRHGLAGALALHALGLTRGTSDLDLVVEARAPDELMRFLGSLGYERLHVSSGYSNHVHADAHVEVLVPRPGAQCGSAARWDLCGGRPQPATAKGRPYRDRPDAVARCARSFEPSQVVMAERRDVTKLKRLNGDGLKAGSRTILCLRCSTRMFSEGGHEEAVRSRRGADREGIREADPWSASLGIWAEGRALTSKGSACTRQRLEC